MGINSHVSFGTRWSVFAHSTSIKPCESGVMPVLPLTAPGYIVISRVGETLPGVFAAAFMPDTAAETLQKSI